MDKKVAALYRRIERAQTDLEAFAVIKSADKLEDATEGLRIGAAIRDAVGRRIDALALARKAALAEEGKRLQLEIRNQPKYTYR